MDEANARKVLILLSEADGYCTSCVANLYDGFIKRWPEHRAMVPVVAEEIGFVYSLRSEGGVYLDSSERLEQRKNAVDLD